MKNELAKVNVDDSIKLQEVANGLYKSGLYPQIKNPAGAYAIVQYGYELGLGPMASLQNINLIQGKPAASGQVMLSLALAIGVKMSVEEESAQKCSITFRRGDMSYNSVFTIEDARQAGLTGKDNWKKYPKEMLYWRCVAKGLRRIAPDAVMGLYTPEELTQGEHTKIDQVKQELTSNHNNAEEPVSAEYEEMATMPQLQKLNILLREHGYEARDEKLAAVNEWLRQQGCSCEVETSKSLTKQQASELIDGFERGIALQPGA